MSDSDLLRRCRDYIIEAHWNHGDGFPLLEEIKTHLALAALRPAKPVFYADDETITDWHKGNRKGGAVDVRVVSRAGGQCNTPLFAAPPPPCPVEPLEKYHEDQGPVCWWAFPVNEPAWIGQPTDDDWPGYHTHWTPHPPIPTPPKGAR